MTPEKVVCSSNVEALNPTRIGGVAVDVTICEMDIHVINKWRWFNLTVSIIGYAVLIAIGTGFFIKSVNQHNPLIAFFSIVFIAWACLKDPWRTFRTYGRFPISRLHLKNDNGVIVSTGKSSGSFVLTTVALDTNGIIPNASYYKVAIVVLLPSGDVTIWPIASLFNIDDANALKESLDRFAAPRS